MSYRVCDSVCDRICVLPHLLVEVPNAHGACNRVCHRTREGGLQGVL